MVSFSVASRLSLPIPPHFMDFLVELINYTDFGILALRLIIGAIFIVHGLPKLKNVSGTAKGVGLPVGLMWLVALFEFGGGLMVLVGFLTQIGALLIAIVMLGALWKKKFEWNIPFTYPDGKTGYEFDLLILAGCAVLFVFGGGLISADAYWLYA